MKTNPLISIITPTYNCAEYLSNAIDSVIQQSYSNWELLIINDGSNDNTAEIIQEYQDSRLRYFEQENKGVSAARNVGLKNMRGKYFCFLDADDELPTQSLTSRLLVFESNNEVEFVDGSVVRIDGDSKKQIGAYNPSYSGNPLNELISLSASCFFGLSWMIKRKPEKSYRFDESLTHGEDLYFYITISNTGRYAYCEEDIYNYTVRHLTAMSNLKGLEEGYFAIAQKLKDIPGVNTNQQQLFKKKIRSMMVKSYLRKGNLSNALRVVFR